MSKQSRKIEVNNLEVKFDRHKGVELQWQWHRRWKDCRSAIGQNRKLIRRCARSCQRRSVNRKAVGVVTLMRSLSEFAVCVAGGGASGLGRVASANFAEAPTGLDERASGADGSGHGTRARCVARHRDHHRRDRGQSETFALRKLSQLNSYLVLQRNPKSPPCCRPS